MAIKFFGYDPGTVKAGWGCIEDDFFYHGSGVIEAEAKLPIEMRLARIYDGVTFSLLKQSPQVVVVEKAYLKTFRRGPGVAKIKPIISIRLGEARGLAMMEAGRMGIPVYEISHQTAKAIVTGRGNASKKAVSFFISKLLNIPERNDENESDALALAYAAAVQFNTLQRLENKFEIRTTDELRRLLAKMGKGRRK